MQLITAFRDKYSFLGNWYPAVIIGRHGIYANAEAAYQACRTDDVCMQRFFQGLTASEALQLSRTVCERPGWQDMKVRAMRTILRKKFSAPQLREKLLATGDAVIQHRACHPDRFWGKDLRGNGENMLGILLMEERERIRSLSGDEPA